MERGRRPRGPGSHRDRSGRRHRRGRGAGRSPRRARRSWPSTCDQATLDDLVGALEGSGHVAVGRRPARPRRPTRRSSRGRARELGGAVRARQPRRRPASPGLARRGHRGRLGLPARHQPQGGVLPAPGRRQRDDRAGQGGRIILFSSQGWWTGGFGGSVAYAATKGGVTTHVPRPRADVRAAPDHGQLRVARARSTRRCS